MTEEYTVLLERIRHKLSKQETATTVSEEPSSRSARDLIRYSEEHPPEPIVEGLIYRENIVLLHGSEESFKSFFVLRAAGSIALGHPLLGYWKVPCARRVGIIETEMNEAHLGERLGRMFPNGDCPENLRFFGEASLRDWRREDLVHKVGVVHDWVKSEGIEVLMIDTANDFFRKGDSPSNEGSVGKFFDELRRIELDACLMVRHDRKRREGANSNDQIRGASEWKEDPEAIIYLDRLDRRTNQLTLEVGKFRYGCKPEPFSVWFDTQNFRLTAVPPVVEVLRSGKQSRQEIVAACLKRFGLCERSVDTMLKIEHDFLKEHQEGHEKMFEVELDTVGQAPWAMFCVSEAGEEW